MMEWISIDEEMPTHEDYDLLLYVKPDETMDPDEGPVMFTGWSDGRYFYLYTEDDPSHKVSKMDRVTHWMSLPEEPFEAGSYAFARFLDEAVETIKEKAMSDGKEGDINEFLNEQTMMNWFGLSPSDLNRLCDSGLPFVKLCDRRVFLAKDVVDYVKRLAKEQRAKDA